MNDTYVEWLIEKKTGAADSLIRIGAYALIIILAGAGMFVSPVFFVPAVAGGVLSYFFLPRLNVEYEYLFLQGELTIDCIYSKSVRKNAAEYSLDKMEFFAPEGSPEIENRSGNVKSVRDFSSGYKDRKRYIMIINTEQSREKVILEPDERIIDNMKMLYPSKVSL
ncbi:MAG: DUF6106 family protein [Lachnospiraceae bacterium]|nr:DUF6106 family protein [Lachnospiraceae bacterium]